MTRPPGSDPEELAEWWQTEGRLKVRCPFCFHFARFCSCKRVRIPSAIETDRGAPMTYFEWSLPDDPDQADDGDAFDDDWDGEWDDEDRRQLGGEWDDDAEALAAPAANQQWIEAEVIE